MVRALENFFNNVILVMAWLGAALIMFIMLIVTAGTISRYIFDINVTWTTELTEYALLYVTFLMAPWVLKQNRHVRVDILLEILRSRRPRLLAIIETIGNILGIIVFSILGYYGVLVTVDNFVRHVTNPTNLLFPKGPLLLVIPLSCICLAIQFIRRTSHWMIILRKGKDSDHYRIKQLQKTDQ